jgi:Ni/Fe-hydrogenase subunit HybB-like protein
MMHNRAFGPYGWAFWLLMLLNVVIPQVLWLRRVRTNTVLLFFVALSINVGMWLERFVIVITSLNRDFMPSAWHLFIPTFWDWATLAGTIGMFFMLLFLFLRLLPMISISETRELVAEPEKAKG